MQLRGWRPARAAVTTILVATLSGQSAGCSFLFVKPPPPPAERGEILNCSTSQAAPAIDLLIASWQVVRILIAINASDSDYRNSPIPREGDIGIGFAMLTLFGTSSGYGFSQTSACRKAAAEGGYYPRPRPRPRVGRQPPRWKLGPPPPSQEKLEEQEEEAAVRARAVERSRAAAGEADSSPDAGTAPEPSVIAKPPVPAAPPARQQTDPE